MTLKPTPRSATWFLEQFGSTSENESAIGDLMEQYRRGRGRIWFWRQVLAIVFVGLYREIRRDMWGVIRGLAKSWCIWGVVQFTFGAILMGHHMWVHPGQHGFGMTASGFPLLTLRVGTTQSFERWDINVLTVLLNVLTLLGVGGYLAAISRMRPQFMLLTFTTSFMTAAMASTVTHLLLMFLDQPAAMDWLLVDLAALLCAPGLLLLGSRLMNSRVKKERSRSIA